jgi:hypothetical protein
LGGGAGIYVCECVCVCACVCVDERKFAVYKMYKKKGCLSIRAIDKL